MPSQMHDPDSATSAAWQHMEEVHRASEPEVLAQLLERARLDAKERAGIEATALELLADLREGQRTGWVNQFLQEYRLNSSEVIALLSLAEAFLRVPDPDTADRLISDKLGDGDWRSHAGRSHSQLVNSATWGLVIGRALVGQHEQANALKRLISRSGEPFVRQAVGAAMRMMVEIANADPQIQEDPKPIVTFEDFGDNALLLWLRCHATEQYPVVASGLRVAIYEAFEEAGISIAFPQRDVHLDASAPIPVRMVEEPSGRS